MSYKCKQWNPSGSVRLPFLFKCSCIFLVHGDFSLFSLLLFYSFIATAVPQLDRSRMFAFCALQKVAHAYLVHYKILLLGTQSKVNPSSSLELHLVAQSGSQLTASQGIMSAGRKLCASAACVTGQKARGKLGCDLTKGLGSMQGLRLASSCRLQCSQDSWSILAEWDVVIRSHQFEVRGLGKMWWATLQSRRLWWEMWRRDPGTSWRRTAIERVWLAEFSEMEAEKGKTRTGCHRYIRSLNAGDKGELFNWSTMLAQEQLGTGCPWIHLDNVNRWKTAIQK